MYKQKIHKIGLFGYVYLFFGLLGMGYYVAILLTNVVVPTANIGVYSASTHLLLAITMMQFVVGMYIKPAIQASVLYAQCLATLLLFCTQLFAVYAALNSNYALPYTSQCALKVGVILFILSLCCHFYTATEKKLTVPNKGPKRNTMLDDIWKTSDF